VKAIAKCLTGYGLTHNINERIMIGDKIMVQEHLDRLFEIRRLREEIDPEMKQCVPIETLQKLK
jgi:hypothetical protein